MTKSSMFNRALWIAALCAGTGGLLEAQSPLRPPDEQQPSPPVPQQKALQQKSPQEKATQQTPAAIGTEPTRIDKASGLLGMEVRNQAAERLGKIRDIVLDINANTVAYCVLGVDEGLFSKEKLLAVPLRAFEASPAGTYLTLNVDKQKLAQAEGIEPGHWPSVSNPAWGAEPFWQDKGSENPLPGATTKPMMPKEPEKPGSQKPESQPKPTQPHPY